MINIRTALAAAILSYEKPLLLAVTALSALLFAQPVKAQSSTLCRFTSGPLSGYTRDYAPQAPLPIGSPCHDDGGSNGVVVAATSLRLPVQGLWGVLQAPPCPFDQTHCDASMPNQHFAYDLIALDKAGQPTSCVGRPVFSPTAGTIIELLDGLPNFAVPGHLAGNHVVIRRSGNEFVLVAHFSPATIKVSQGQKVAAGQQLAECGNSGNSTTPHVHIHMQSGPQVLEFGTPGIPVSFGGVKVWMAGSCKKKAAYSPQRGDILC
jgi:hypothetical protein